MIQVGKRIGIWYLQNMLLAYGITVGLLAATAYGLDRAIFPTSVMRGSVLATYVFSNLCAGFRMGKGVKKKQYLWGFVQGLGYVGILFLCSWIGNSFQMGQLQTMFTIAMLCACSGMFGGMLS